MVLLPWLIRRVGTKGTLALGNRGLVASRGDVLVFLIPCVIDGALLLYFLRGFRAPVSSPAHAQKPPQTLLPRFRRHEGRSLA